ESAGIQRLEPKSQLEQRLHITRCLMRYPIALGARELNAHAIVNTECELLLDVEEATERVALPQWVRRGRRCRDAHDGCLQRELVPCALDASLNQRARTQQPPTPNRRRRLDAPRLGQLDLVQQLLNSHSLDDA